METSKSRLLWRYIVRTCYQLPRPQRQEMLSWARYEFDRHKDETDVQTIKYLVSNGTKQVRDVAKNIPNIRL